MISLSRHIELLLLEHNCVIVPGLGGFIANMAGAVYNDTADSDRLFIPPYRTIGFNPQLQVNDGLLVQSYMQAYDASYPAAYLQMEKDIERLNTHLNLFGEYKLEGIGTLHKSLGDNIVLSSPEAGILTPWLYGTYSFGIKSLAEVKMEREIQLTASQTNIMPIQTETDFKIKEKEEAADDEEKNVVNIKRKDKDLQVSKHNYFAEFGIAAAIAAIIFLVWLIPNTVTMNGKQETVIAGTPLVENKTDNPTISNKEKVQEHAAHASTKEVKADATHNAATTAKTNENSTTTADVSSTKKQETKIETKKSYTIVLASYVTEKNSNILIENLASQGFAEAKFVKMGKVTRIIYSAFDTEQEAMNALLSLREKNNSFKDAWTLKID